MTIEEHPEPDRFHLNETYSNRGTVCCELKNHKKAKKVWQNALFLLPSDAMVKRILMECIHNNPEMPAAIRLGSPRVERLVAGRKNLKRTGTCPFKRS